MSIFSHINTEQICVINCELNGVAGKLPYLQPLRKVRIVLCRRLYCDVRLVSDAGAVVRHLHLYSRIVDQVVEKVSQILVCFLSIPGKYVQLVR